MHRAQTAPDPRYVREVSILSRFSFGEITREDVRPAVRLDDEARPQLKQSESSAGLPGNRKTLRKSKSSETLRKSKSSELDPPRTASVHVARPQAERLNTTGFHDQRHRGHSSGAMLHIEAFEFEAPPQSAAMRHGISTPTLAPAALRHRRPGSRPSALAGAQLPSLPWPAGAAPAAAMGPLLGKGALPPTDAQQMAVQPDVRDELRSAPRSTPTLSPRGLDGLEPDPTSPATATATAAAPPPRRRRRRSSSRISHSSGIRRSSRISLASSASPTAYASALAKYDSARWFQIWQFPFALLVSLAHAAQADAQFSFARALLISLAHAAQADVGPGGRRVRSPGISIGISIGVTISSDLDRRDGFDGFVTVGVEARQDQDCALETARPRWRPDNL